ncbi:MAG: ATP synthase F0 subunit C [Bacteroidales bacterium]|nr:ATP synthase F0 subunit C [Bacteroidales bacterium]
MDLLSVLLQAVTNNVDLSFWKAVGACIGAGIVAFSAAMGIGKIAASAMEAMARQPEINSDLRTSMIIAAALIEGVAFFGLVICLLVAIA